MAIEELLEDPKLAKLEKYDELTSLYHVEGIGLHICFQRLSSPFYLAFARRISRLHTPRWLAVIIRVPGVRIPQFLGFGVDSIEFSVAT
jgi:hypothetical protein